MASASGGVVHRGLEFGQHIQKDGMHYEQPLRRFDRPADLGGGSLERQQGADGRKNGIGQAGPLSSLCQHNHRGRLESSISSQLGSEAGTGKVPDDTKPRKGHSVSVSFCTLYFRIFSSSSSTPKPGPGRTPT